MLDHHRLCNPATRVPIPFFVDPVGCTATLVEERFAAAGELLPGSSAGLLLGAIISDTLAFRSPTTTPRDRAAAERLAAQLQIVDLQAFGEEVVLAGAGLGDRSGEEIVSEDFKQYRSAAGGLVVAQAEVRGLHEIGPRAADLRAALERLRAAHQAELALLMLTDPVRATSRLIACGEARLIAKLPFAHGSDDLYDAPAVVSRKKQLVPALLAALE